MTHARYRLALTPAATTSDAVRGCEADVLGHWYGDTLDSLDEAYGAHEPQSVFLAVTRDDGLVAGACRLILPGALPLKTVSDIGKEPWGVDAQECLRLAGIDVSRTLDIATIAVRRELGAGGRSVASALYHGLVRATRLGEAPWVVAVIDRRARGLLAMLGLPLDTLPGTTAASYMGSAACAPVWTHVPSVLAAQRVSNPEAHRLVGEGYGLTDVLLPTDAELLAALPVRRQIALPHLDEAAATALSR